LSKPWEGNQMAMAEEVKARLREARLRKRGVVLSDVPPADLLLFTDHVKEELNAALLPVTADGKSKQCYLRRATPAQVEALAQGLPHRFTRAVFHAGGGRALEKEVVVFHALVIDRLLKKVGVRKPETYYGTMSNRTEVVTSVSPTRLRCVRACRSHECPGLGGAIADWPGWKTWRGYALVPSRVPVSGCAAVMRDNAEETPHGWVVVCKRSWMGGGRPFYAARGVDVPGWMTVDVANLDSRLSAVTTAASWGPVDGIVCHYFNCALSRPQERR
jgi:hypothetical protein